MSLSPREAAERQAQQRYIIMNVARVGGLMLLLVGIAITRDQLSVSLPWALGAALAVIGLLEFFFLPAILAKRWKAGDRARGDQHE